MLHLSTYPVFTIAQPGRFWDTFLVERTESLTVFLETRNEQRALVYRRPVAEPSSGSK